MSVKAKKFVAEKGYYEILEVSPLATTNEIQRSFERLCDEYVNLKDEDIQTRKSSAETLYTLTKAYETLTDPFQRMNYDDRRFGGKQNNNNEVETIFKEGLKASRASNTEAAVRFFKEVVFLFPHRPIYRVNLAIACFEAGDRQRSVKELRMALMLDPTNEFAQEVVAKLLFGVSDKKGLGGFFVNKANRQLAAIAASILVLTGTVAFGGPKLLSLYNKYMNGNTEETRLAKAKLLKSKMPEDLRKAIDNKSNNPYPMANANNKSYQASDIIISKLDDNFKPDGKVYDYSSQKATKKTYYKAQGMIMIDYENGSVLNYKLQDVVGWKKDTEKGIPVIITKGNEIIPVQTDIPVTLPDGKTINAGDKNFPTNAFPEYGIAQNQNTSNVNIPTSNNINSVNEVPSTEKPNNNPDNNTPPAPINNQNQGNAPPPPPAGDIPLKNNGE